MTETIITYRQNIPIKVISVQHYQSPHNHEFDIGRRKPSFSFLYIVKGSVTFSTIDKTTEGIAGDFFYVPYGIRYNSSWFGEAGTEYYCIHAYPTNLGNSFVDPYALQKVSELSIPESLEAIKGIYYALENKEENFASTIGQYYSLYAKVLPLLKINESTNYPELLIQAIKYIETNYKDSLTVPSIAAALGVSESTLYHLFQKNMDTTPTKYYNRIRLEQAISSFGTNDSIEQIAYSNGFESYGYFREIFKAYTGMTPRQYRMQKYGKSHCT